MRPKVAINASGIHGGGGVQVAVSLVDEIFRIDATDLDIYFFVSTEISDELHRLGSPVVKSNNYVEVNTHGLWALISKLNLQIYQFPIVFTVFGPNYLSLQCGYQIVGFAQAWIVDGSAYAGLGFSATVRGKLKYYFQKIFFRRADLLVVELESVKEKVLNCRVAGEGGVEVVRNCVSGIYFSPDKWLPIPEVAASRFKIGYICRDYPHKNTDFLPLVKEVLVGKYQLEVDFIVTLNDVEWGKKSIYFRENVINIGPLSVAQCPNFYRFVDAVIFPSLLECFSVTPLESMVMKKPLFASDRDFVHDVCGDFANYFDPFDPESAADAIADYVNRSDKAPKILLAAREHALKFSSPYGRAVKCVEIIRRSLSKKCSLT